jgi:hypothetical protein
MTVCVYRWAAVGRTGPTGQGLLGRGGAAQAVCLGLAAATNQLAWFIAPFLLAGIFLSARTRVGGRPARAIVARYLAIALLTFAAINAPFIAWGPGAWLSGVFAPITQHAVPYGQGLIGLTTLDRIGGGALEFYAYGAALLYLALLGLFWTDFPRLGRCVLIFPVAALYASERSLAEYWLVPLGLVVVSILCSGIDQAASHGTDGLDRVLRHLPAGRLSPTAASVVARCALFAPAVACLLVAMATPGPLELTVLSAHDARGTGAVDRLVVMVRNSSSRSLEPRFAVNNLGLIGGFWPVASGPVELAPGMLARYVLNAPSAQVEPPPGSRYLLQAVTAAPQTISSSPRISAPSHS